MTVPSVNVNITDQIEFVEFYPNFVPEKNEYLPFYHDSRSQIFSISG